nr:hypothetical protein [uncultured Rhizobium sp.]
MASNHDLIASMILGRLAPKLSEPRDLEAYDIWEDIGHLYQDVNELDHDFITVMEDLEACEEITVGEQFDGSGVCQHFADVRYTGAVSAKPKRILQEKHMSELSPKELKSLRDRVLLYVYENGAANYGYSMPADNICRDLDVGAHELRQVIMMLINQGMLSKSELQSLGINSHGQREAERLKPAFLMTSGTDQSGVTINANYSTVQLAGANSSQSASLNIEQSVLHQLLFEIEREIPTLDLTPAKADEARGLLEALKAAVGAKMADAGVRAIGASLSSILVTSGSALGQRLLELLGIALS